MKFIITTRDIESAYKSYQIDWPEKVINKNSRVFKRTFNQNEYEKIQINWTIVKYVGEGSTIFGRGWGEVNSNLLVTPEIDIRQIINHLNNLEKIDNSYIPDEEDEMKIYGAFIYKEIKGIKRSGFYNLISLIYRDGKWIKDFHDSNFIITKFHLRGIVEI